MRSRSMTARLVCSGLLAALALCALGAGSALAAETPEWYSAKQTPEWQQSATKLTEALGTKWKSTIVLQDTGNGSGAAECEDTEEGTVGPGATGTIKSIALSGCKPAPKSKTHNNKGEEVTNVCEGAEGKKTLTVEVLGLPWHTEQVISEGAIRNVISGESIGEGNEAPGFVIRCPVAGLEKTDTCHEEEANKFSTSLADVAGGVSATFGTEKLACTLGGKKQGEITATQLIEATKGSKLEANPVDGTFSKLTGSLAVKGTGELTLEDKGDAKGAVGFTCPTAIEGTVGAGSKGTITSYEITKFSYCKPVGVCEKLESVGWPPLPWSAELYESEGSIRDRLTTVTKEELEKGGLWGYSFYCKVSATKFEDVCSMNVSPEINNGAEGDVVAVFSEKLTTTSCSKDEKEGKAVWRGELKLAPTANATAIEVKK